MDFSRKCSFVLMIFIIIFLVVFNQFLSLVNAQPDIDTSSGNSSNAGPCANLSDSARKKCHDTLIRTTLEEQKSNFTVEETEHNWNILNLKTDFFAGAGKQFNFLNCGFNFACTLTQLIKNILTVVYTIAAVFSVLAITYHGFSLIYYSAIGQPDKYNRSVEGIKNVVFGIIFLLTSFLILKIINPALVGV